jgi:hypothetical protein
MSQRTNPFTPSFGSVPPFMAGREQLVQEILDGLDNGVGDPHRATIFIGARGSGKTALLAYIAEEALHRGWIHADVTTTDGMLEDIIQRSEDAASEFVSRPPGSRITGVSLAGAGLSREVVSKPKGNWRSQMNKLLDELNEQGIGLVITVDEVNSQAGELRLLAAAFQHFVREKRKVALLMAGLPHHVFKLMEDKSVSFLRRAYQQHLGLIGEHDVSEAMRRTVEFSGRSVNGQALQRMVEASGGFPFLIQLIGYHVWRQRPEAKTITIEDAEKGIEYGRGVMEDMVIKSTLRELTGKDIGFLKAMSADPEESRISDVSARLGISANNANQTRRRLINLGIIGSRGRGRLGFEIPMLKEYLHMEKKRD